MDFFSLRNPDLRPCFSHEKLPAWVLQAFCLRIKVGDSRQLHFAHVDIQGNVTGWEVEDRGFRGERSLFFAHIGSNAGRILIAPRAMIVVDYFSGHGLPNDICVSTAGDIAPFQTEILRTLCKGAPVIACEPPGCERFSAQVLELASHAEIVTNPAWTKPTPELSDSQPVDITPAVAANTLGGPGDPVSIEQLDAIFSETHDEVPKKGRSKQTKKSAPLLAFF